MVKQATRIWTCIVAVIVLISMLSLHVSAINTDNTIL